MSQSTSRSASPDSNSLSDAAEVNRQVLRDRAAKISEETRLIGRQRVGDAIGFQDASKVCQLPPELLAMVFSHVTKKTDLFSVMLSCKYWASIVIDTIWFRPGINSKSTLHKICAVMKLSDTHWDYRSFIKRLNLSLVPHYIDDELLSLFVGSTNLERITLVNCSKIHSKTICDLLNGCSKLQSIDLTGVNDITDDIYNQLSSQCERLQGLYAPGSRNVSGGAVLKLINSCSQLKRIKLSDCADIDDNIVHSLVLNCPYLVELDLHGCEKVTNKSLYEIFLNLESLKEFKISRNAHIDWKCFETPTGSMMSLDKLRVLDFTQCQNITDKAIEKLVQLAPKLRNVVLSKCTSITDQSLRSLALLNKNLHYIHLGHCSNITDEGAKILIRSCYRLQYIDFACCNQLTNATVMELSTLPKLRRIGLVKCSLINDVGISALAENRTLEESLERIHLSYCIHLTIFPIYKLLKACPKLTHISLTGISQFLRPDITKYCREPPSEFNQHQRSIFCVFSGDGVNNLRRHLSELVETTEEHDRESLELAQIIRGLSQVVMNPPSYQTLQNSASRLRFVSFSRQAMDFFSDYNLEEVGIGEEDIELFLRCVFGGIPTSHTPIIQRFFQLMHDRPAVRRRRQQQRINNGGLAGLQQAEIAMRMSRTSNVDIITDHVGMGGENNACPPERVIELINNTEGGDFSRRLLNLSREIGFDISDRTRPPGFTDELFSRLVMVSTMPNGQINQIELSRRVMQANLFLRISAHFNAQDPQYEPPQLLSGSAQSLSEVHGQGQEQVQQQQQQQQEADGDQVMN